MLHAPAGHDGFFFPFPYYFVVSFLSLTASYRPVTYRSVENTWCLPHCRSQRPRVTSSSQHDHASLKRWTGNADKSSSSFLFFFRLSPMMRASVVNISDAWSMLAARWSAIRRNWRHRKLCFLPCNLWPVAHAIESSSKKKKKGRSRNF